MANSISKARKEKDELEKFSQLLKRKCSKTASAMSKALKKKVEEALTGSI